MHQEHVTRWGVVAVISLGGVLGALHVGKMPVALPVIREDLQLSLVAGGFLVSVFSGLGMFAAVILGAMADAVGRARLIALGFMCLAAGGVLGALSRDAAVLMTSRFVEGIGFISISVALPAVMAAAAQGRDRSLALSLWSIHMPVGMALAVIAAPAVFAVADWRTLWSAVAALSIAGGAAVLRGMARVELPPRPVGRPLRTIRDTASRVGLMLLALAFAAYAFQWMSVMVWLPTFLGAELQMTTLQAAATTAVVILINVPGNILGGWSVRSGVAPHRLILFSASVMALTAVGIFGPWLDDSIRLLLCLVFSLVAGFVPTSLFNSVPRLSPTPAHLGAANGMLVQGSAIGQFFGAPLIAAAVSASDGRWSGAILPMLAAAIICATAGTRGATSATE